MTIQTATRINPTLPRELCARVANILERTVIEENPGIGEFARARQVRKLMACMDADTASAILSAENPVQEQSTFAEFRLMVEGIIARSLGEEAPELSKAERLSQARQLVLEMDAETAVAILCAEARGE